MSDTVKVYLGDDYYTHEYWQDYDPPQTYWSKDRIFDIPREQRDRWEAAMDAYEEMQAEIRALLKERREAQQVERAANEAEAEKRRQAREALLIRPWRKP